MNRYLLRSMLFVPTYRTSFLDRALECGADALILDLEDSIPFEVKDQARQNIRDYAQNGKFAGQKVFIRLNDFDSRMLHEDLNSCLHVDVLGFMPTKIRTYHDLMYYDKLLTQLEIENHLPDGHFKLTPLIETTSAVMDAYNIARASTRTVALCFGGEDFLDDLSGLHGHPPRAFDYPRAAIALAARACNLQPIDTPYLDLDDFSGFVSEETVSFEQGYAGCMLIHPKQIPYANQCFTPSAEEVSRSRRIVEAIEASALKGSGVAMLDGKMIGPPMRKRAQKVLDLMAWIEESHG